MPFSRPTLSTIKAQTAQDISGAVEGADPLLRFSNLGIMGKVLSNLTNLLYGFLDWIAKQAVPFTATAEFLEGWAGLKGVVRQAATAAVFPVSFPAVDGSGAAVPAGTLVTRGDGASFTTNADATVSSGTVTAVVTADVPGAAGNTDAGTVMTLGSAIANVSASGTAGAAVTIGADVELDDSLKSRMLQRYAAPPQGGAFTDYIEWATAVPGVTRAWVKPLGMGAGTVVVYTMLDVSEADDGGFPQGSNGVASGETRASAATGDQLAVANAIFPLRPVTALVYSVAPTANTVNFTITGLTAASTATKAAIAAAIDAVFLSVGGPGGALDAGGIVQGTVDLGLIESSIAAIGNTGGFVITVPTGNITSSTGALPVRGTITYP